MINIPNSQVDIPPIVPKVLPDKKMAEQFLNAIDCNSTHYFRCINKDQHTIQTSSLDECLQLNEQGYGAFFIVNKLKDNAPAQKGENIEAVRAVFFDMDSQISDLDVYLKSIPLKPSVVVNTSPQKYHFYFFVEDWPLDQFKPFQQHLAEMFKADPAVVDLPRIMRLAGSVHWKGEPFLSNVVGDIADFDWEQGEIREAFKFDYSTKQKKLVHENTKAEISDGSEWQIDYVRELLTYLKPTEQDYFKWRDIGFTLKSYFADHPDIASELFHEFSKRDAARYKERECENQIANSSADGTMRIGTLRKIASDAGANIQAISRKHSAGFPAVSDSNCSISDKLDSRRVVDYLTPLPFTNGVSKPLPVIDNLDEIVKRLETVVRYNVIKKTNEIFILDSSFTQDNFSSCSLTTLESEATKFGLGNTSKIKDQVIVLGEKNLFNPVEEYILSKPWDGHDRLTEFTNTIVSKSCSKLKSILILRWMISAVTVALDTGKTAQGILVFTGGQGIGKTRWFNKLIPQDLKLTKDGALLRPDDKDSITQILSFWLVELGEVDATFRKSDIAQLKAFITKHEDEVRLPYARCSSKWKRRTVFFASVNGKNFLVDETGNRRFWTIDVESINYDHNIDMQQLWAQINDLRLCGERHYLNDEESVLLNEQNKDHTQTDPIEDLILTKLNWSADKQFWTFMASTDIAENIGLKNHSKAEINKLIRALKKHNGDRMERNKDARKYLCPPRITHSFPPMNI